MKKRESENQGSPGFWRSLKTGDIVSLSDDEAFDEALKAERPGPKTSGSSYSSRDFAVDYRVGDIRVFAIRGPEDFSPRQRPFPQHKASPAGAEYRFIELRRESPQAESEGSLYLTLVSPPGGGEVDASGADIRLYFIPRGMEGGTRDDWIDAGDSWLFIPPPNPEDFISSQLEYAPYPDVPPIEEGGREIKRIFARVGPGCLYAEALDTEAPVILVEYQAEPQPEGPAALNPLMIVIEEGWMRPDGSEPEEGGYLSVMLGKTLSPTDIEVWQMEGSSRQ